MKPRLVCNITWTVKKNIRLVTWLLIPGCVWNQKHCFLSIHKVFGGRPHNPSKFRNSPCARIAKILWRRLDLWILILRAQYVDLIGQKQSEPKAWLMNINKTNWRYWRDSTWRQGCLFNSHKVNLHNSMIHEYLIYVISVWIRLHFSLIMS